jgi:1-acyl-sn-glycerol-3-phosphate acyltransferase
MSKDFGLPVVPVATNLGCFWKQTDKLKTPGTATSSSCRPCPRAWRRTPSWTLMEATIEGRTNELIAQARGEPVKPSVLVEWNEGGQEAREKAARIPNLLP